MLVARRNARVKLASEKKPDRDFTQGELPCVYRKLKPGGSDGEVRPKWRPNL
jgi:hypothetical protein